MKPSITLKHLHINREEYLKGVASIDSRIANLRKDLDKAANDRMATLGAVQALDRLIAQVTPKAEPAPTQPSK